MRRKSHLYLGHALLDTFLPNLSALPARAFLLGCTEPDMNPTTYFKGSLRSQWLRGHNYENASRFLNRLAVRLERKNRLNLWDYYSLGKLMHYTQDAFTAAHNTSFPVDLGSHRLYERQLQDWFLTQPAPDSCGDVPSVSASQIIRRSHDVYIQQPSNINRDTIFAVTVCFWVMARILRSVTG